MSTQLSLLKLHKAETEVLHAFHDFCETHGLVYYLAYGTLLGAIRHNGFIPWDDDTDVIMPRPDYEKFLKLFPQENNITHLHLASIENLPHYHLAFAKLHDSRFATLSPNAQLRKPYFLGPWIDIFPLDNMSNNVKTAKRLRKKMIFWSRLRYLHACKYSLKGLKAFIRRNLYLLTAFIPTSFFVRKMDKLCQSYASENFTKYVATISHPVPPADKIMPSSYFIKRELHQFEKYQFYVPSRWHEILTDLYGDYMTPIKTGGHIAAE